MDIGLIRCFFFSDLTIKTLVFFLFEEKRIKPVCCLIFLTCDLLTVYIKD